MCVPIVCPDESSLIAESKFHKPRIPDDGTLKSFQFVDRDRTKPGFTNRTRPARRSCVRGTFTFDCKGRFRVAEQEERRSARDKIPSCATDDLARASVESF